MALLWDGSQNTGFPQPPLERSFPSGPYSPLQLPGDSSSNLGPQYADFTSGKLQSCSTFCLGSSCPCAKSSSNSSLDSLNSSDSILESSQSKDEEHVSLPHSRHVFLCYRQPNEWPSSPFSFDWGVMPRALRTAVQGNEAVAPQKPLLTVCEGRDDGAAGCYNGDVLLFPDLLLFRAMTRFDIECFVEEALLQPMCQPGKGRLQPELLTGCHMFVCCQNTSGSNCGRSGPRVAAKLAAELAQRGLSEKQFRVWRCCHLSTSGVQCKGNVVIFGSISAPPRDADAAASEHRISKAEWYNGVTPADVADLVDSHILGGRVVVRLWAGSMSEGGKSTRGRNRRLSLDLVKPGTSLTSGFLSNPALVGEVMDQGGGLLPMHGTAHAMETAFDREMMATHWHHQPNYNTATIRHRHGPNRGGEAPAFALSTYSLQPHNSSTSQLQSLRSTHSCPEESPREGYIGHSQGQDSREGSSRGESREGSSRGGSSRGGRGDIRSPGKVGRKSPSWGSPSALTRANLSGATASQTSTPLLEASGHLLRPCPGTDASEGDDQWEVACSAVSEGHVDTGHQGDVGQCDNIITEMQLGNAGEGQGHAGELVPVNDWPFPRQNERGTGRKRQVVRGAAADKSSVWGCFRGGSKGAYSLAFSAGCIVAVAAGVSVLVAVGRARGGSQHN